MRRMWGGDKLLVGLRWKGREGGGGLLTGQARSAL